MTEPTIVIHATVMHLIPEYHQAILKSSDGHELAITRKTQGIELNSLEVGQHFECTVTATLPRVLFARLIQPK